MFSPSSLMLPLTVAPGMVSCIRLSVRKKVLLPQPEGPMSAVILFGFKTRLTPAIAWNEPKYALTSFATSFLATVVSHERADRCLLDTWAGAAADCDVLHFLLQLVVTGRRLARTRAMTVSIKTRTMSVSAPAQARS